MAALSKQAYVEPLLKVLYLAGGRATSGEALEQVRLEMESRLSEEDYAQSLRSGPIWHRRLYAARKILLKDGLLVSPPQLNAWELSEAGKRRAKKLVSAPDQPENLQRHDIRNLAARVATIERFIEELRSAIAGRKSN